MSSEPTSPVDPLALPDALRERLLSPALIVDLPRVRRNIAAVIRSVGDVDRWRPHVKTTKIPEVYAELAQAGVRHFKCATTREARVLLGELARLEIDAAEVLVAYPLVSPALRELGRIAALFPRSRVAVLCEDERDLAAIPAHVDVFVDLNPGMNRTGVPRDRWGEVRQLARRAGRRFRGLHYYDGHQLDRDLVMRRERIQQGYAELLGLRDELVCGGVEVAEIVTAGTPALLAAAAYAPLSRLAGTRHRVSPGTVVFHDARSAEQNPGLDLHAAAVLFTRVISNPAPDIVTCDAGSKSIAAEAGDPCAVVAGREGLVALRPSEEHLPLRVLAGEVPRRGDELQLVPRHICPTVNLAEQAVLLDGDHFRVVAVAARAHDLLAQA